MKNKSIFKVIFTIAGTFLLIVMVGIMAFNFTKDARIIRKPLFSVVNGNSGKDVKPKEEASDTGFKTLKFEQKPAEEEKPEPTQKGNTDKKPEKLKIEVLNYTGDDKVLDYVCTALENFGFDVAGKNQQGKVEETTIISRNSSDAAKQVFQILKAGKTVKWPDSKSDFDVTVKLGTDYSP